MGECPFQPNEQVAAYLRDSGGDEQEQSIAQQEHEIRLYCKAHRLILTDIYTDEAKAGSTTINRDAFWNMIHHFHNGAGERGILIWRTNRFGRNINDSQYYKADLRRRGFIVHSLKDNIPEGSAGQLIEFALDWKDQVFIEQLSEDVKRGLRQLVQVYGCVPGVPPRGFKREPVHIGKRRDGADHTGHRWIPDPEMIPLVQRAFEMRAKGETITRIISATGLYKSNNCFTTFFTNRLYIGELIFGDLSIPNYCEPIITREIWDEVQRVGRRRRLGQTPKDHPRRIASSFVLSGVLYCQECGAPMSGHSFKEWDYYVCSARKTKHTCNARRIPRASLEKAILDALTEKMLSLDNLLAVQLEIQNAWSLHSQENDKARREQEARLRKVQSKIRNVIEAISEYGKSKALLQELASLEFTEAEGIAALGKFDSAERPMEYTRPQLADIADAVRNELQSDDINKTRAAIRSLVARVIACRTDDQIIGVLECYRVIGRVPPRGAETLTQVYPIVVKIKQRKAPLLTV